MALRRSIMQVLQMESVVLNYLKFEMTTLTAKCFLRRFVRVPQGLNEVLSLQLEHLPSYIAELSLLEYNLFFYAPSLIVASAIFLAKYILLPSGKPWNSTLRRYTLYQPSDLRDCVMALHNLSATPTILAYSSQGKIQPTQVINIETIQYSCNKRVWGLEAQLLENHERVGVGGLEVRRLGDLGEARSSRHDTLGLSKGEGGRGITSRHDASGLLGGGWEGPRSTTPRGSRGGMGRRHDASRLSGGWEEPRGHFLGITQILQFFMWPIDRALMST
ncbi:hypothetical protein H5410_026425 [Solanum commersonii]|uniref:Cyclin C-terminal domain-containing protein n=1 Tax=Solanum commersonii TaxID=4109 RepID=A0A9J5YYK9_SOLCO|nr:hypothetical protein H5410_026425 [Solanum commersonii]